MYDQTYNADGIFAAFGMLIMVLAFFTYFWLSWTQYKIAQKCGQHESAWWSFIPILNVFLWVKMAGKEWWWFFLCFVPFLAIVPLMEAAKNCGHKSSWGVLSYFPVLNYFALGVMAFGKGTPTRSSSPHQFDRPRQPTGVA